MHVVLTSATDTQRSLIEQATQKVARAVDQVILKRALTPSIRDRDRVETLEHPERMDTLGAISAFYGRPEFHDASSALFTCGSEISPTLKKVRKYAAGGAVVDLRWKSDFSPLWTPERSRAHFEQLLDERRSVLPEAEHCTLRNSIRVARNNDKRLGIGPRYGHVQQNETMYARWFRHGDRPRPCAVILHGYMGGHLPMEERIWPVRRLYDGGMDVVLTVLPMHGPRRNKRRRLKQPEFPGGDPRTAIEGFRHLVHDHLALFNYLRDGRVQSIGTLGMSLGGYSAALLSTVAKNLQFGVFYMPLSSVADFALRTGRMSGERSQQAAQAAALDRAYWAVSPLARPSRLPEGRALVISGEADMVTGLRHGSQLARHFNAETSNFTGGHILQVGRGAAFGPMWTMLQAAGLHAE